MGNRIWIELERPKGDTPEEREKHGNEIAEKANNFIKRLFGPDTAYAFFWSERKSMWAFGNVSFKYLRENGEWLNLDFLGRPLDVTAEQYEPPK